MMAQAPESTRRRWRWSGRSSVCAGVAASSALTLLAFPPFDLWLLVFLVPMPLIWATERAVHSRIQGRSSAIASTLGVMPMWAWEQQWVFEVSAIGAVLLIVALSLYTGLLIWLACRVASRWRWPAWAAMPVLLAGVEWLRGVVLFDGYPWLLTVHPLVESEALSRAAATVGASGVSLLAYLVSCGLYGTIRASGRARVWGASMAFGSAGAWVLCSLPQTVETDGDLRVAVIQTNLGQGVKQGWPPPQRMADLDAMLAMTEAAAIADPSPDLIVWPETMFPGASLDADAVSEERAAQLIWSTSDDVEWPVLNWVLFRGWDGFSEPAPVTGPVPHNGRLIVPTVVAADSLFVWQQRLGVPFLVGSEGFDGLRIAQDPETGALDTSWDASYNSSYLVAGGMVQGDRYDKMHLTPFGEVMPYISAWPWLENRLLNVGIGASGMSFHLSRGTEPNWHEVPTTRGPIRIGTPICFEGTVPQVCRRLAYVDGQRQADLLVQLTNDGWFGTFDTAREQHLQIVRWRAIELGTSVVRAANSGISAAIDPRGRVIDAGVDGVRARTAGVVHVSVPLALDATIYARVGDIAGWASLLCTGGLVFGTVFRREQRSESDAADKPED